MSNKKMAFNNTRRADKCRLAFTANEPQNDLSCDSFNLYVTALSQLKKKGRNDEQV